MSPPVRPWRNWYHCGGNTYGSWPLGDSRGSRTRHHRQHIIGDYRFPPPPRYYERLLQRSLHLLRHKPLLLDDEVRPRVAQLLADDLARRQVEVLAVSVSRMHFHLLARFVPADVDAHEHLAAMGIKLTHRLPTSPRSAYGIDPAPRRLLGMARAVTTRALKLSGAIGPQTQVWAKRPHCVPIVDRGHQVAAYRYILEHAQQGAAVWRYGTHA
jgi:hypothetical protein